MQPFECVGFSDVPQFTKEEIVDIPSLSAKAIFFMIERSVPVCVLIVLVERLQKVVKDVICRCGNRFSCRSPTHRATVRFNVLLNEIPDSLVAKTLSANRVVRG